ncbi:flippase [Patescibacteria group bacterium]|nr:flippase [Patescibacteria group bacterium]
MTINKIRSLFLDNLTSNQTIYKNSFWLMLAEIISKVPIFFLNLWIVRYLGAQAYGQFSFVFAFCALFATLTDLGLSTLIIRDIAKNKHQIKKYLDNLLVLKLILGLITFAVIFVAIQFMGKSPEIEFAVYMVAIFTIAISLVAFFQSVFQAFEKMEYLALSKVIYSASLLILIFLIIWQKGQITSLVSGYVYSALITLMSVLVFVRKKFTKFLFELDFNFWKKILSQAWPFGLIGLLSSLYVQMAVIQINLISTDFETGLYNAAYQFVFVFTTLANIFFCSLFPTLSKEYQNSKTKFYRLLDFFSKKIIMFSIIFCLVLLIASQKLILLLYGPNYLGSVVILRVLLVATVIFIINQICSLALGIAGRQKQYLKPLLVGVTAMLLLNYPLILLWGGLGAALSAVISSSVIVMMVTAKFVYFKKIDLQ